MNVPFALHNYAKVVIVTTRRLLINVKIIPKDNVQMSLLIVLKRLLVITLVTVQKTTQEHTHYITKENR